MELRSLQVLRAAAALLVVLAHARDQFPSCSALMPNSFGLGGVDIFFVISGFVMTYTTGLRAYHPAEFLKRRLQRIVPLYWTMTLFTAALLLAAPKLMRDSKFAWGDLFTSLAFWPHWNTGKPDSISPMLKLGWTLNYEMFFYCLFALGIAMAPLKRTAALAVAFAALLALATTGRFTGPPIGFWADPIVFEFVLGCLIGALDLKGLLARAQRWAAVVLLLVGVGVFVACADLPIHRLFARGGGAFLIVAGAVAMERTGAFAFRWRAPLFLGDASYSIYLGHLFPVIGFRVLWDKLHLPIATPVEAAAFMALCVAVGVGSGCLLYLFVEKPLTRLARRIVWPARGHGAVPAAS